jgi:hypothetical protein
MVLFESKSMCLSSKSGELFDLHANEYTVGLPRNRAEQGRLARFPEIRQITGLLRCAIHASGGELRASK